MSLKNQLDGNGKERLRNHKKLQSDFFATIELSKKLALTKKTQIKQKKSNRLIEMYKFAKSTVVQLLDQKQLLPKILCFRPTIAPEICQQRPKKTGKKNQSKSLQIMT